MHTLLKNPSLKLLLARDKLIMQDTFENGLGSWQTDGSWHKVTVDSNADQSSGLDGNLALDCMGAYEAGTVEKTVELQNYGEISFEHYVQNNKNEGTNYLKFYIDDTLKLEIKGPSPWYRCDPIGLTPGEHTLKFEYVLEGAPNEKKAVVDTIVIEEAKDVPCLITTYKPPKPIKNLAKNSILRGYTTYQEMVESDTEIEFVAAFNGLEFHEFMIQSDREFYFVDEFGVCYRGIFEEAPEPKSIALRKVYYVELILVASSKVGIGFC